MAFCTNCGSEVRDGATFCTNCGTPMAPAGAPQPQDATEPLQRPAEPTVPLQPAPVTEPIQAPEAKAPDTPPIPAPAPAPQPSAQPQATVPIPQPGIPQPGAQPQAQQSAPQPSAEPQAAPGQFSRSAAQQQKKSRKGIVIALIAVIAAALVAGGVGIAWMKGVIGNHGNSSAATTSAATTADNPASDFVGTWDVVGLESDGVYYTAEEYGITPGTITMTLEEDGTAHMNAVTGDVMSGTWQATSDTAGTVTFDADVNTLELTSTGLTLVDPGGNKIYFEIGVSPATSSDGPTGSDVAAGTGAGIGAGAGSSTTTSSSSSYFTGTWSLYAMNSEGTYTEIADMGLDEGFITITLESDGTAHMDAADGDSLGGGTWEDFGNGQGTVTFGNEVNDITLADSSLVLTDPNGDMMYFK